jgi:hypothetical protein
MEEAMNFLRILERIVGRKSQRPTISAVTSGKTPPGGLRNMAMLSRLTFREPPEYYSGGKKLTVITTSDINPRTGKVFEDYEARRRKRREEEETHRANRCFGAIDVYPRDE